MALPGCSPVQAGLGIIIWPWVFLSRTMLKCNCLFPSQSPPLKWEQCCHSFICSSTEQIDTGYLLCALSRAMRTRQPLPISLKTSRCSYAQSQVMVNPGKNIKQDEEYCGGGDALPTHASREVLTVELQGSWPADRPTSCLLWGVSSATGVTFLRLKSTLPAPYD